MTGPPRYRRELALANLVRLRDHLQAQRDVFEHMGLSVHGGNTAQVWLDQALPVVASAFSELDTAEDADRLVREAEQHAAKGGS